jgi:hypothetical protein
MNEFVSPAGAGHGLQVALRIRPLNTNELQSNSSNTSFEMIPELNAVTYSPNLCQNTQIFQVDHLFDEMDTVETIYHHIGHEIILRCVSGFSGAIFACLSNHIPLFSLCALQME